MFRGVVTAHERPISVPAPADETLVARYRANYGLSDDVDLTAEQIRGHLELERALTAALLASTPETRTATFERCYDELYRRLPWLTSTGAPRSPSQWTAALGRPPQRVYEVGSGAGALALALADLGYDVEATDISSERGHERAASPGLTWTTTDGVNIEAFARRGPYDAVISDQVVEHLHPDDVVRHFAGCREILRPGGRLLFRTPHAFTGPHDISRVFGLDRPVGMHLREYTNRELVGHLRAAGFRSIAAVMPLPPLAARGGPAAVTSRAYLRSLLALERILGTVEPARRRRAVDRLPGPLLPRIFLIARASRRSTSDASRPER